MDNKGRDEVDKLKTKFMSAWHNVKYSWAFKTKTSFSRNSPVFLLGKCYHFKVEDEEDVSACCEASDLDQVVTGTVDAFRMDFASRLWLTYREEMPPLPDSTLTSDCGWGCMLRAGQMLLGQALVLHFLSRDWVWSEALRLQPLDTETRSSIAARRLVASLEATLQGPPSPPRPAPHAPPGGPAEEADAHLRDVYHRTLVSWFGDRPSAPLGLHRLVRLGLTLGRRAGDWYGPAVVAHILRRAVEEAADPGLAGITAYVSQDSTVYSGDVLDCHRPPGAGHTSTGSETPPSPLDNRPPASSPLASRAVVILIPVRLGGEKTNPEYFNFVKGILSLEYCIGIIGGKPRQACYFLGFQDDTLIYMDPHYCQSSVDVSMRADEAPLWSYHCPSPKKMSFSKMDPSCTIGFYSRTAQDYERICQEVSKVLQVSRQRYPAFSFLPGHSRDYDLTTHEKREWPFIREAPPTTTTAGDFVLL